MGGEDGGWKGGTSGWYTGLFSFHCRSYSLSSNTSPSSALLAALSALCVFLSAASYHAPCRLCALHAARKRMAPLRRHMATSTSDEA